MAWKETIWHLVKNQTGKMQRSEENFIQFRNLQRMAMYQNLLSYGWMLLKQRAHNRTEIALHQK